MHIAPKLSGAEQDGADWEATCPLCGHGGFRVSVARVKRYRHVFTCACKLCRCDQRAMPALRAAILGLGVMRGCLGVYGLNMGPAADPVATAALRETVDVILNWPGLDPATMRIMLADARGDKVPDEYGDFARFAREIGIGRANAYNLAAKHCRPPDSPPPPGEGSADA